MDELIALGSHSTPTTVITDDSGHDELIMGFDRRKIQDLVGAKKA